jgi:hypothetical protein
MKRFVLISMIFCFCFILFANDSKPGLLKSTSFKLTYKNTQVEIDLNSKINILQEQIGTPLENVESKKFRNYKNYVWPGLVLQVLPSNNIIQLIDIEDPCISTIDGVKIGDLKSKVLEIYGIPRVTKDKYISYYFSTFDETWYMIFYLSEGNISSIQIHRIE